MSVRRGQLGVLAGYALHRAMEGPRAATSDARSCCFEHYLASSPDEPERLYVVCVLAAERAEDVEQALFFRETAAMAARLKHDGIVGVRELGEHEGRPYFVQEYLAAVDAAALIALRAAEPRRLPVAIAATLLHGAVAALRFVHEAGWAHGGLQPEHILVDAGGDVSLSGFVEGNFVARFGLAAQHTGFTAPEQRRAAAAALDAEAEPARREVSPALDCYAIGALFYRLLTGRAQPDEWEPRWNGIMMELSAAGVPGDALRRVLDFLHRSLAERPEQRFASMGKLARAFGPVSVELDAPKSRMVVANAVRDLLPPIVRIEHEAAEARSGARARSSEPALLIDEDDLRALTIAAESRSLERVEQVEVSVRSSSSGGGRGGDVVTRVGGVVGASAVGSSGPSSRPRSTRLVSSSSNPSLRSLSPELRQQIGPHPLEILARSRYQVLGELGSGGTGTVYKILDTTLSEILALKVLRSDLTSDTAWLQRFKRELKITRDLEHAHILPAYHLEQLDGLYFFTMRYVDGETLYETVRTRGALTIEDGIPILGAVGRALAAAHERGIVHRDFKSANVIIERVTHHPYLMDFGIALAPDNPGLTITGQGIGTPMYMAPEQAMGDPIGPAADIYAFGVVLYEAFSGRLPFRGTTTVAVYTAQVKADYEPLPRIAPHLPAALCALVARCLEPHPADRPQRMADVVRELEALIAD